MPADSRSWSKTAAIWDSPDLQQETDALVAEARKKTGHLLSQIFTSFTVKYPQLYVDVNRDQVHTMGVNLADVFSTLQIYLGSLYVNDFNLFGRTWQVVVQAEAKFRNNVEAVRRLKVRNAAGGMVPLGKRGGDPRGQRPARRAALQHVSGRGRAGRHGRRASARARPSPRFKNWPRPSSRQR